MSKAFFDVFPYVKLENRLKARMEQVAVQKIVNVTSKGFLRVHIESSYLIPKEDIYKAEEALSDMLFKSGDNRSVKLYEHFNLSGQYNGRTVMEMYRDSILIELKEYSHVLYIIFKKAQITYPEDNRIHLALEDTVFVHMQQEELARILEKIFIERCGLSVSFSYEYVAVKSSKTEQDDQMIAAKVAEISRRAMGARAKNGGEEDGSAASTNTENAVISDKAPSTTTKKGNGTGMSGQNGNAASAAQTKTVPATGQKSGENSGKDDKGSFFEGKPKKADYRRPLKSSDNPDVICGKDFEEGAMKIEEIVGEMGEVVIRGEVIAMDEREIRNERTILIFDVTDYTDTITIKMFVRNEQLKEVKENIKKGAFLKIKGIAMMDNFDKEIAISSVLGIKKSSDFRVKRKDNSATKRVELHCHTKMSDMDGVSEVKDIIKRAYSWGHPAIAITDHGVVQAFPTANHVWDDLWKAEKGRCKEAGIEPDKDNFFKVIYGCEAYLVDDLTDIVTGQVEGGTLQDSFVVFDIETTGFSPVKNRIIEIGAVKVEQGVITDRFSQFVNPQTPIPFEINQLTGISDDMVSGAPVIETVLPEFLEFVKGCKLVAHNASFDTLTQNQMKIYQTNFINI